jgi:hypothetical protein
MFGVRKETRKNRSLERRILPVAIVSVMTVLIPPVGAAQEFSDALRVSTQGLFFNARALGMGNAYSTIGYDFSALHFNPATMSVNGRGAYTMSMAADGYKSSSDYYGSNVDFTIRSGTSSWGRVIRRARISTRDSSMRA